MPTLSKTSRRRRLNVLFLCTGNSARSILAEAILNRSGGKDFRAFSAGSQPKGEVNPHAVALLKKLKFETGALRCKSWDEFAQPDAPKMDFIFTVCDNAAGEVCPVWPGQPVTAHWGIPDPAAATGSEQDVAAAFARAFHQMRNRIAAFTALPFSKLDRMSLQASVRQIGQMPHDAEETA